MKISSIGINQMMSQMQGIRRNGGISRDNLAQMQKGVESHSGFASQLSGELGKVSESFSSIDSDQNGLLSQFEMESYAKAEGLVDPQMTDEDLSSGRHGGGMRKSQKNILNKLLKEAEAIEEEEEEEEEQALALKKLLSRNSKENESIAQDLLSGTETTSSQESSNQLSQALKKHAIEAYSNNESTGSEWLKAIS